MFRNVFKRETVVVRDTEVQKAVDLLFPDIQLVKEEEGEYYVDRSVDSNLYAALVDLQEGVNDEVVQNTIKHVIKTLEEARKLLKAEQKPMGTDANLLMVDIK